LNCLGAIGIGVFGVLFANATAPTLLILFGVLVTLCNNLLSYSLHSYRSELFPTRIRSRAIVFVYSWSRLSAALSGLVVAFLLNLGGVNAVFALIAFCDGHRRSDDRRLGSPYPRPRPGSDRPLAQFAMPR
jgi:putative MFS transporter